MGATEELGLRFDVILINLNVETETLPLTSPFWLNTGEICDATPAPGTRKRHCLKHHCLAGSWMATLIHRFLLAFRKSHRFKNSKIKSLA